jgi:hypothetical protein
MFPRSPSREAITVQDPRDSDDGVFSYDDAHTVVVVTAVPAEPVDGKRAVWLHSWSLTDLAGEPVTTAMPLGWVVKENWRLAQAATLLDTEATSNREAMASLYRLLEERGQLIAGLQERLDGLVETLEGRSTLSLAIHDQVDRTTADLDERVWQVERKLLQMTAGAAHLGTVAKRVLGYEVDDEDQDEIKMTVDGVLQEMAAFGDVAREMAKSLALAEQNR